MEILAEISGLANQTCRSGWVTDWISIPVNKIRIWKFCISTNVKIMHTHLKTEVWNILKLQERMLVEQL